MRTTVRNAYDPKTRDYCNMIVVDEERGVKYIFDSDGVWTPMTSKSGEGASYEYVDNVAKEAERKSKIYADLQDEEVLSQAKAYTDEHAGTSKSYVDGQDAATLQSAKDYTDAHSGQGGVSQEYVDQHDASTLTSAKDYTDGVAATVTNTAAATAEQIANTVVSTAVGQLDVPVFTLSTTDIGEGASLEANHFYGVYE